MKLKITLVFFALFFIAGFWLARQPSSTGFAGLSSPGNLQVFFCPLDDCPSELIQRLDFAQKTIDIAIYSFTLDSVSDALVEAHQRGVLVRVLFDAGQSASEFSQDEVLEQAGIPIKRLDLPRGLLHDKYAVFDQSVVATGSYNYSDNASRYNKENLVFISDTAIAKEFGQDFERLWDQAG